MLLSWIFLLVIYIYIYIYIYNKDVAIHNIAIYILEGMDESIYYIGVPL